MFKPIVPPDKNTVLFTAKLPEELVTQVNDAAEKSGLARNEFVKQAFKYVLDEGKKD